MLKLAENVFFVRPLRNDAFVPLSPDSAMGLRLLGEGKGT